MIDHKMLQCLDNSAEDLCSVALFLCVQIVGLGHSRLTHATETSWNSTTDVFIGKMLSLIYVEVSKFYNEDLWY